MNRWKKIYLVLGLAGPFGLLQGMESQDNQDFWGLAGGQEGGGLLDSLSGHFVPGDELLRHKTGVVADTVAEMFNRKTINPAFAKAEALKVEWVAEGKRYVKKGKRVIKKEIKDVGKEAKRGIKKFLRKEGEKIKKDFKQESTSLLTKAVVGTLLVITAYFASKLIWDALDRHFKKQRLDYTVTPINGSLPKGAQGPNPFSRLVFSQATTDRLMEIVERTALIKRKILEGDQTCTYPGLVLCGQKGSGKRQFAENLARYLNMEFIDLSVASMTKYKEETELAKAYDDFFQGIAQKSIPGAIVFIDNAGMLLSNRKPVDNTPLSRQISCFIEQVEKGNSKFMVILSAQTEEEPSLSAAMASIINPNPVIVFERPAVAQRVQLLEMYRDLLFSGPDISNECAESALENLSDEKIQTIAKRLEGVVAKDMYDMVKSIKMDALLSPYDRVTEKSIEKIVQDVVEMVEKRKK